MSITLTFDPALFRKQFPAFSDPTKYPDEMLQMYWDMAVCFSTDQSWCDTFNPEDDCRQLALNMLTAHLLSIGTAEASGEGSTGFVTSATIDKVSVTQLSPRVIDDWQFWLLGTPYGVQYLALLNANVVGGFYIGGSNERGSFRAAGGRFPGRR